MYPAGRTNVRTHNQWYEKQKFNITMLFNMKDSKKLVHEFRMTTGVCDSFS